MYDAVLDASYERLFLVMELVDGVPLSAYLDPRRQLPVSWAAAVAAQVATVLSYAHDVPVIHRDLKPGNILVARDGTVKVLDFGIAAILRTDVTKLTATGSPIGTHQYMSPEQVRGGRITPQTDLYALGCVLHELLSGRLAFEAENEYLLMYQHVNGAPTPLRQLRPDVPEALEELVLHLLRKAPEARPADTQEVYARLLPFLPPPGEEPGASDAGPAGAPDPTGVVRHPFAPRVRAQAARCRAELGQVTEALAALQGVLNVMRAVDSDVSEEAVELRHNIGMLLIAQGRAVEARQVLEPLHEDMCMVFGPDDEATVEIAEALAVIRLGLDGSAS